MDVAGAAVIGAGYAGVRTAPLNGLLVEGNIASLPAAFFPLSGADLETNALRLVSTDVMPTAIAGQSLEGSFYYFTTPGDTGIRFHDGTDWRKPGATTLSTTNTVDASATLFRQAPPIDLTADCPVNSALTGVILHSANACPSDCGIDNGRVTRIDAVCKTLQ